MRYTHIEEAFIRPDTDVFSSSRGGSWCDVQTCRLLTSGHIFHIAAQSQHWMTVQVGQKPTQTEISLGSKTVRALHLSGSINLVPNEMETRWQFDQPTDDILVGFAPALLSHVAGRSGAAEERVELVSSLGATDSTIERIALMLNDEVESGSANGRLFGEGMATALAAHLLAHYVAFPVRFKEYRRGLGKADLKRVTEFIGDNLSGDVSLDTLSGLVALSPYHFCRLFKQSTGLSPHQFVIQVRVERAKTLLLRGNLNVSQVALEVGFCASTHLNRHMKRLMGVNPSHFSPRSP